MGRKIKKKGWWLALHELSVDVIETCEIGMGYGEQAVPQAYRSSDRDAMVVADARLYQTTKRTQQPVCKRFERRSEIGSSHNYS